MGVSLTVLASGSRGNTALVSSSSTRVLVDAGISCRETFRRMKALGEDPHSLSGILITHEHPDHVYGLAVLARKLNIPVYMTEATHYAWARSLRDDADELPKLGRLEVFCSGRCFQIGDIAVMPFTSRTMPPIQLDSPSKRKASNSGSRPIWAMCQSVSAITYAAAMSW